MRFSLSTLRVSLVCAAALRLTAQAECVTDILKMPVSDLSREGTVTGIVTSVFQWQKSSCIIADTSDADGAGIYVGGQMPGNPIATLEGAERLSAGDVVIVSGRFSEMLLEPGVIARKIEVIGHRELSPPKLHGVSELMLGRSNNRRVAVDGVIWGIRTPDTVGAALTAMRVGTDEGPITVHVAGVHPGLASLRDCHVRIEGICLPVCNSRGELVSAELEAFSEKSIIRLEDGSDASHLRKIRGTVVYSAPGERYFVVRLQDGRYPGISVRVNALTGADIPSVGQYVEAEGFHTMIKSVGVLEDGVCTVLGDHGEQCLPDEISGDSLKCLLTRYSPQDFDCDYRFVKIKARVKSADCHLDGIAELDLETPYGNFSAEVPAPSDFADRFVDLPMAEVTGILDVRHGRSPLNGRALTVETVRMKLRGIDDVRILPDPEAQARRKSRLIRYAAIYLHIPLAGAVLIFLFVAWRRRSVVAAISADRRQTAEALHDSVSQQLAGARLMIFSVKSRDDVNDGAKKGLDLAISMLESARRDVRDAIMRLKSDENLRRPIEDIIRENAAAMTKRGEVKVRTRLCEFPSWVAGEIKTNILAIVQESVTNAIRHGKAKQIVIIAETSGHGQDTARQGLTISILNDGAPFDATRALGPEAGHFGISNMRERASRIGFNITFGQKRNWTEVRLVNDE